MSGSGETGSGSGDGGRLARGQAATEAAGRALAATLEPGDVILIEGEVGTGKSTLVRAAMRELGVAGPIPSPTFTIGRHYSGAGQRAPVAHLDLYRLGGDGEEAPGLLAGYFGPDRITFIEWPGGSGEELASGAKRIIRIELEHIDPGSRRIRVETGA